jgi:hypothetical protein
MLHCVRSNLQLVKAEETHKSLKTRTGRTASAGYLHVSVDIPSQRGRPRFGDGGDGQQICLGDANMPNKQS